MSDLCRVIKAQIRCVCVVENVCLICAESLKKVTAADSLLWSQTDVSPGVCMDVGVTSCVCVSVIRALQRRLAGRAVAVVLHQTHTDDKTLTLADRKTNGCEGGEEESSTLSSQTEKSHSTCKSGSFGLERWIFSPLMERG